MFRTDGLEVAHELLKAGCARVRPREVFPVVAPEDDAQKAGRGMWNEKAKTAWEKKHGVGGK